MQTESVVVVGAGVAGLACALQLHRAGRAVVVLEAEHEVGGRVRSSRVGGLTIDHGFQVLFTAYPTLRRFVDIAALEPRPFLPAARIVHRGRHSLVGDALRDPSLLMDTVTARVIPLGDKLRMLALRRFAKSLSIDDCFAERFAVVSTRAFLHGRGFAVGTIDGFFAPFYGGILLDRSLATSASILLFTFKMLAEGDTVVPARGMGAITAAMAAALPGGAVRTGVRVRSIETNDGRATGVILDDGSRVAADHTVLATDAPAAVALAASAGVRLTAPRGALGCTTLYYATDRSPIPGRALWLNAAADAVVSHAITITDVAPEYASTGALVAATVVGASAELSDDELDARARAELAAMAATACRAGGPPDAATRMTRVALWRVPYAQFAQPPGWNSQPPTSACGLRNLWRASETLHSSSLEGAARGGVHAAGAILSTTHP